MERAVFDQGFPQIKYALGTADDQEALQIAAEKYQDAAFQAKYGILAGNGSFRSVALDYVKTLYAKAEVDPSKRRAAKAAEAIVTNYLNPYFKTTSVTAITHAKLHQYTEWRRDYWTTGDGASRKFLDPYERNGKKVPPLARHVQASDATLKRENVTLHGVFKHAVNKGLMKSGDVPKQELKKPKDGKRPCFSTEEYSTLVLASVQRVADAVDNPNVLFARGMLHEFICIAANTGMRPSEAFNLNWENIEGLDLCSDTEVIDTQIRLHVYGKGKPPSILVPEYTVVGNFRNIANIFRYRFGQLPSPEMPVFCNLQGERIKSFNKSLNALLDACDLRTDNFGRKFSSYSFRHYYATQAIRDPKISIFQLAINMRTQVKMIEDYYLGATAGDFEDVLSGRHRR